MQKTTVALRRPPARPAAPAPEGLATAICAVTGVVDEVNDIIVPGAFAATLAKRRPKVVHAHDWKTDIGRVLHIEEWKPGDKRLPALGPDGKAWPAAAGALVATMQFNLRTQRGRESWENVRFYAQSGEAAWSIGFRVPTKMKSERADGTRMIYGLDLFEVSPVLHGAHPLTMALEVKSAANAVWEARTGIETKMVRGVDVKTAEKAAGSGAMVALYPPADVAADLARPDGSPAEDLHITLAFLGDASDVPDPEALAASLAAAVAGTGTLVGTVGGLGVFPGGEQGIPVWLPVDVPGLVELRGRVVDALQAAGVPQASAHGYTPHLTLGYDLADVAPAGSTPVVFDDAFLVVGDQRWPIPLTAADVAAPLEVKAAAAAVRSALEAKDAGGADKNKGNAEALRKWFTEGEGAVKIAWGTPGDFGRCVTIASKHMTPEQAKGWCNLRHHDALGIYPATHAKLEGKAHPDITTATAAVAAARPSDMETKTMPYMIGSYEERRDRVREAVTALLLVPATAPSDPDQLVERGWVSVQAMFDDRVIVDVYQPRHDGNGDSYSITYKLDGDRVELGEPQKVEMSLVALPADGGDEVEADADATATARFVSPAVDQIADATARLSGSPLQGKALTDAVTPPLLALFDTLALKGVDVAGMVLPEDQWQAEDDDATVGGDEEDPTDGVAVPQLVPEDDEPATDDPAVDPPADDGTAAPVEAKSADELVELDAEDVMRQLAALSL